MKIIFGVNEKLLFCLYMLLVSSQKENRNQQKLVLQINGNQNWPNKLPSVVLKLLYSQLKITHSTTFLTKFAAVTSAKERPRGLMRMWSCSLLTRTYDKTNT